jgi:hypothetical protein
MTWKTQDRRTSFPGAEKEKEDDQSADDGGCHGDGVEDGDQAAQP